MKALWTLFWQILRFDRGPEETPSSLPLLASLVLIDYLISMAGQSISRDNINLQYVVFIPLIALAVELASLRMLMAFKSVSFRFVQTANTILGCDIILTLISLPVSLAVLALPEKSALLPVFGILQMVLLGWGLGFRAFVYHRSINIGLIQANMLALALYLLALTFMVQAFPELLAQAQAAAAASQH
ncbi:MAG TPA: hypothetical protein VFW49_15890 [Fluviicoccus sp.]|nr:hypothetical protein [Fluviicoccus sp.]